MRFKDKVCVITGGDSGIGLATAEQMATEGAHVVILSRNPEKGEQAIQQLESKGDGEVLFVRTDVGVDADLEHAIEQIKSKFGRIDVLVNNAAMMTFKPILELDVKEWDAVINVNLRAVFLLCKAALPLMKNGAIVNVSSVHAHQSTPNVVPYAASKGALEAFSRGLSLEIGPEIARINCVAPGAVDTPMLWNNPNVKSGKEKIEGKIGKPEELAFAICFIASSEASYINGTTLVVDGGRLDNL